MFPPRDDHEIGIRRTVDLYAEIRLPQVDDLGSQLIAIGTLRPKTRDC